MSEDQYLLDYESECSFSDASDPESISTNVASKQDVEAFLKTLPVAPISSRKRLDVFEYVLPPRYRIQPPPTKWTWRGRVTIAVRGTSSKQTETACEMATLTDATEASPPRLASFLLPGQDLHLASFYDVADVATLLPGYKPPHQFAYLTGLGSDTFNTLCTFMEKKKMAAVIPALWDGDALGKILFLPHSTARALRPPAGFPFHNGLLVVLLFDQTRPPHDLTPLLFPRSSSNSTITPFFPKVDWLHTLRIDRPFHLALRILRLPDDHRARALAHGSVAWNRYTRDAAIRRDHQHLLSILDRSEVGPVPAADASATIVFVHVADLGHVHELPLLAERRLQPDVWFCMYGAHPMVRRAWWGSREIYGCGGIVTFTADAVLADIWAVIRTIRAVSAHPLWDCYLMPQIVGLADRLDEAREFELLAHMGEPQLAWTRLFDAIRDGQVALMRTPAPDTDPRGASAASQRWIVAHGLLRPLTADAARERCISAFARTYGALAASPKSQERLLARARADVQADMRRVQSTVVFAERYRRYVVLDVAQEEGIRCWNLKDGIEWKMVGTLELS